MFLDELYHGHNLLRQITMILKHHPDDLSSKGLYEFVESGTDENNHLREQLKRYEIKDFQLCYIDHIRRLYENSFGGFQYLFTDVPTLLHTAIDEQSNNDLREKFQSKLNLTDENLEVDKIQLTIHEITEFLNELKKIENTLLQHSTQSLREICEYVAIESSILSLIPDAIKCEHYVSLNIHLIQMRSILQERTIDIQEKETKIWSEKFDIQVDNQQQTNRYQIYLNPTISDDRNLNNNGKDEWTFPSMETDVIDPELETEPRLEVPENIEPETTIECKSFFKLTVRFVPSTSSTLVEEVYKQKHSILPTTKAQKFTLKHPDGKITSHLCKCENLVENLQKTCADKKYDLDIFVVIDQSQIVVDFSRLQRMSSEYYIIEKAQVIEIRFQFRTNLLKYSATSNCDILAIINRFIDDSQLEFTSPDVRLCFLDELGKYIDGKTIGDIYRFDNNSVVNILVKEDNITSDSSEIILRIKEGKLIIYLYIYIYKEYLSVCSLCIFSPYELMEPNFPGEEQNLLFIEKILLLRPQKAHLCISPIRL
jgi:hypothetical protein